jgi:hypothetical protein
MKGAAVTLTEASVAGVNSLEHVEMLVQSALVQQDKATKALGDKQRLDAAFAALRNFSRFFKRTPGEHLRHSKVARAAALLLVGAKQRRMKAEVKHVVELLDEAYR